MATYRLNDDGTVEVKHNGAWLTLDEVLALKDRQLRESREEVLQLEKEREQREAELNAPKVAHKNDDEYEEDEITEYSIGGGKLISYPGRALPNSGTYVPPTITTTSTSPYANGGIVSSGGWSVPKDQAYNLGMPKVQVTRGGITYEATTPEDAKDADMRGASADLAWIDESHLSVGNYFEGEPPSKSIIQRIKDSLDKW